MTKNKWKARRMQQSNDASPKSTFTMLSRIMALTGINYYSQRTQPITDNKKTRGRGNLL